MLRNILFLWMIAAQLLLTVMANAQNGITIKKSLEGSKGELVANASMMVQDSTYFDATLVNKLESNYPVKNAVTFKLDEYSFTYPGAAFTATANVRIAYLGTDKVVHSVDKALSINYDSASFYSARNSFVFRDAHRVTVTVLSVTCSNPSLIGLLMLENEMNVKPVFILDKVSDTVKNIQMVSPSNTDSTDQVKVRWDAVVGASEYDLEWAYIDSTALMNGRYGNPVKSSLVFRNNATRVSISKNEYNIPLMYDNGGVLYVRLRAVSVKDKFQRIETAWSADFTNGKGAFNFTGHQRRLNWQSNISFAEEGKRKVVVQYFDGSLFNRQTVTKDNTTDTVLAAETMYDQQGRPVIQVLPAPTLSNIIKYTRNFNTAVNGAEYDKAQYDSLAATSQFLKTSANPMGTGKGAANYYSSQNSHANEGIEKFIPDANGYPFTETVYTSDNTGRISRQSGVGPVYKVGGNHETVYYYGHATQNELDAIFGTDAGDETHYFKNMVRDANGQMSVSYLDMHGRTIATALAGSADSGRLKDLSSNTTASVTDTLSGMGKTSYGDLDLSIRSSLPVPIKEWYTFNYSLVPPVLKKQDCYGKDIFYTGKYDLTIKITDDSFNQLLPGGNPVIKTFRNYTADSVVNFSLELDKGTYTIVKSLKINEDSLNAYRENVFMKGRVCTSLETIIQQQRALMKDTGCVPTCESCRTSLGADTTFARKYMQQIGLPLSDSVRYRAEISTGYAKALEGCDLLCQKIAESDMVRKSMLADLTAPSGQYANPDSTAYDYSIFSDKKGTSTPRYQDTTFTYLDEDGRPAMVFDESKDMLVRPQFLQPAQFTAKFQSSWANALLRFHPEYCKLLEYEKHKQSQLWDDSFSIVDTYMEAKAKGYLNPTNGSQFSAVGNNPLNQDPFVRENGGAYKATIEGLLSNYDNKGYNIWSISAMSILCAYGDNSCVARFATIDKVFNESSMCSGDLNMIWRNFRENYLRLKRKFIQDLVDNAACPAGAAKVSASDLGKAGMVANFNNAENALTENGLGYYTNANFDKTVLTDSITKAMQQSYSDNCNAYVSTWMQQLAPCSYQPNDWAAIKVKLLEVCKAGSDIDHPLGSSSVPDNSNLESKSFEAVIKKYNTDHNINITGCSGLLLTIPAPYYGQTIAVNKPVFTKPKDCECDKVTTLKKEYDIAHLPQENFSGYLLRTRKMKITQSNLDDLLNACNASGSCSFMDHAVMIPPAFQCYTPAPCANCRVVESLYTDFKNLYGITPIVPEADTFQQRKNELFAAYMNNRLGYSFSVADYLSFRDSCRLYGYSDTLINTSPPNISSFVAGNGSKIIDMKRTRDGNFILAGYTYALNNTPDKALLIKASSSGAILWSRTFDAGPQADYFVKINETANGDLIAAGVCKNPIMPMELAMGVPAFGTLVRLDAQGNVRWKRGIYSGSATGDDMRDAIELSNGDIAFASNYDAYSISCDWTAGVVSSSGNLKWLRRIGTDASDLSQAIVEDHDKLIMAGLNYNGQFNADIVKLDKVNGGFLEVKNYSQYKKADVWGLYNLPGGGYRMAITRSGTNDGANSEGGIVDINSNGTVRRCLSFSRPQGLDASFFASGQLSDGSMLFAPSLVENPAGIYVAKMNPDYTVDLPRMLQQKLAGSQVRNLWLSSDSTFVAGGNWGRNPGLFTFALNKMPTCNDEFDISNSDETITVSDLSLNINDSISTSSFDFDVVVANMSLATVNQFCAGAGDGSSITLYKGPLLCGRSAPVFDEVPLETVNKCSDSTFYLVNTATEIYKAITDSLHDDFNISYINTCMEAANREMFTVSHGQREYQYTLYYYDQAGNLVKTIPPAGVIIDRSTGWLESVKLARRAGGNKVPVHSLPTKYRYNTLNQVVEQISPDGGISRFWYDRLGRLVVSQNAQQQIDKNYSYTLYDYLGRITEVGQLKSTDAISNQISRSEAKLKQWLDAAASTKVQVTMTVYDEAYSPITPLFAAANLRNRVSWSAVYNNAKDIDSLHHANASYYSYDIHGNVDTLLQDYRGSTLAAKDYRFIKLGYDYDLVSGKVNKVSYQPGMPDAFYHRYTYDAENRITNVETSTDDFFWEKEAFYQYYKHGPLARAVMGQQQVQGLDYAYTLQGWLKGVNGTSLSPTLDMGSDGITKSLVAADAFGFALHYYGDNDYKSIGTNANRFASGSGTDTSIFKPLFNGNIAAMSVNLPAVGVPLLYTYRYDVLNRLSSMTTAKGLNTSSNIWTPSKLDDFGESVTYDANGNIQSYIRNGNKTFAGSPLAMDTLMYSYKLNNNQLDYIDDKVNDRNYANDIDKQTPGNYSYDAIGNLIRDRGSKIDSIYWTVYGKIQRIKKSDGTIITFTYDVAGNRVSKRVKNVETWYVRDATGNVMAIYTFGDSTINNGNLSLIESDIYGSSRLGLLNRQVNVQKFATPDTLVMPGLGTGINTIFTRGNKVFELSNHLGNVLATISDRKRPVSIDGTTTDHFNPIISTAQDYYPFGSLMPGRGGRVTTGGWASGTDNVNGYTVPSTLTISSRSNNQPSEYVASTGIAFTEGFQAGVGDDFRAYIADAGYGGGKGGSGAGASGAGGYRYGFNGKEKDDEVKGEGNELNFGARVYDPRVGRFLSVDPLIASYPDISPYLYAEDNPTYLIDVEGMAAVDFNTVDPPTKTQPSIRTSPPQRTPDPHRVAEGGRILRGIFRGAKYIGSNNPVGLAIRATFEPASLGTGDIPAPNPNFVPEEAILKDIMHLTNDPAKDLSDDEKQRLEDRINSGMASQNEKLQYRMLGKSGALYNEGEAPTGASGRIKYELENGQMYGRFNGKYLGFYEYSVENGLELDLSIPKELQKMGLGTEMFNDAIKATKATRFTATWVYGSLYEGGMSTNLKVYLDGLSAGKDIDKAAWDTPSGQWAKQHEFKNVEVKNTKNGVKATFTK